MTQEFQPCADPHNGMTKVPHTAHRFIGRTHEPLPPGGFRAFQEVFKHVDHPQDRFSMTKTLPDLHFRKRLSAVGFEDLPSFFCESSLFETSVGQASAFLPLALVGIISAQVGSGIVLGARYSCLLIIFA